MATTTPSRSATHEWSVSLPGAAAHERRNSSGSTEVRIIQRLTSGSLR